MGKKLTKRGGFVLPLVLVFVLVMGIGIETLLSVSAFQKAVTARYDIYVDEFAAADSAICKAYGTIKFILDYGIKTNDLDIILPDLHPPNVPGVEFMLIGEYANYIQPDGAWQYAVEDEGPWRGLYSLKRYYWIRAWAQRNDPVSQRFVHPGVKVRQRIGVGLIPLYQYGIFYDNICEIIPGATFHEYGRVHSNENLYFDAETGVGSYYHDRVTVAGSIFHGPHPASGKTVRNGGVEFYNGTSLVSMKMEDGTWLDSGNLDWVNLAQSRWAGYVLDSAHGIERLPLPIPPAEPPRAIIERESVDDPPSLQQVKFEYDATMKIVREGDGQLHCYVRETAEDPWVAVPPTYQKGTETKSIIQQSSFYNYREGKTIRSLDVNIANMRESGSYVTPALTPPNGILYLSEESAGGQEGAVRIINGAELPGSYDASGGFTIASDDPIYIKGNFNTIASKLALVAGDAINILSGNWSDANNTFSSRVAAATQTRAVFMGGNVPSVSGNYSGGVENYFRYLEDWTGKTHTFYGSIINLWESEIAMGRWIYGSPYYTAPNRNWNWDTGLGAGVGPPGCPYVYYIYREGWSIES